MVCTYAMPALMRLRLSSIAAWFCRNNCLHLCVQLRNPCFLRPISLFFFHTVKEKARSPLRAGTPCLCEPVQSLHKGSLFFRQGYGHRSCALCLALFSLSRSLSFSLSLSFFLQGLGVSVADPQAFGVFSLSLSLYLAGLLAWSVRGKTPPARRPTPQGSRRSV